MLLLTLVASAWLTGRIYGSREPLKLAYLLAAVLLLGSVLSGGMPQAHRRRGKHPLVGPALTGAVLFVWTLVSGSVARLVPAVDRAVEEVLRQSDAGSTLALVAALTVAGVAEEVFYRGAWFERVRLPIVTATVAHMLSTLPAGNVALTAAAGMIGGACGLSRRTSGGWFAPAVVHVTWSLLVVAFLPR